MTDRNGPDGPKGPRLLEAMPKPLLALFLLLGVTSIGIAVFLLLKPPSFETVSVQDRRPPPSGTHSHDVGRVFPVPLPSSIRSVEAPCPAVEGVTPKGGVGAVERYELMLRAVCTLSGRGTPDELNAAIAGLRGATLRTADFRRTGVESSVDFGSRTIFLNVKFAQREMPVAHVVPVLLHDAWHLANASEQVTAEQEVLARTVELQACRQLISVKDWPRWCRDARAIVQLGPAKAAEALIAAGYPR